MYYLHRIEDEQDYSEHYYSSPKIKELKKDIQKLHTSNLAVLQVIDDIKEQLDSIYEKYTNKVNRNVEGFVVNYRNIISKYVRMKNGKLQEHFDRGE